MQARVVNVQIHRDLQADNPVELGWHRDESQEQKGVPSKHGFTTTYWFYFHNIIKQLVDKQLANMVLPPPPEHEGELQHEQYMQRLQQLVGDQLANMVISIQQMLPQMIVRPGDDEGGSRAQLPPLFSSSRPYIRNVHPNRTSVMSIFMTPCIIQTNHITTFTWRKIVLYVYFVTGRMDIKKKQNGLYDVQPFLIYRPTNKLFRFEISVVYSTSVTELQCADQLLEIFPRCILC